MRTEKYYAALRKKLKNRQDAAGKSYKLKYKKGNFEFLRIASRRIGKDDRIMLIRAGIHGDEISGPLTILEHIGDILDYAHERSIKLIIYPLANPSGFDRGLRYNIDNDRGAGGNNDFLRYELANGKITDDIKKGGKFENWHWASDKKLKIKLPLETALMHKLLEKDPLTRIKAAIDLHQDYITPDAAPAAYHYAFGNLKRYGDIVKKIEKIVPILKNTEIGAGQADAMRSDRNGFIVRHDGTLGDLFCRLGTEYCVTVETMGSTPPDKAHQVNLAWIYGIIDLIK